MKGKKKTYVFNIEPEKQVVWEGQAEEITHEIISQLKTHLVVPTTHQLQTHRGWKKELQAAQTTANIDISRNVWGRVWSFETLKMTEIYWDVKIKCKPANLELVVSSEFISKLHFSVNSTKEAASYLYYWLMRLHQDPGLPGYF